MKKNELELAKRIAFNLKLYREAASLTAEKLAYEYGISKSYISEIENQKKLPTLKMLLKISTALKIDIKQLLE